MPKENKSNFGTFRNSFEFRIQRKIRDRKTLVHAIHVYAQARQPQEMKFLFRRAGNWIFGFRRRQNLGHAKRKKKEEEEERKKRRIVSGPTFRGEITLQFLARSTFRCCIARRHLPLPTHR